MVFQGDIKKWQTTTHNARVENLFESKIYSASLSAGKRCVVVMEGFFEYKKIDYGPSEVYFLQSPDNSLLKAAGLFATLKTEQVKTDQLRNNVFSNIKTEFFLGRIFEQLYSDNNRGRE